MINDIMWQSFVPLWQGFRAVSDRIMVTGGYALFLKQRWLISRPEIKTVVNVGDWQDFNPRVTKDFDLIAGIDLIASTEQQKSVDIVLKSLDFEPVPGHEYWKFRKTVGTEQFIILEFHSAPPEKSIDNIKVDERRVKHIPSLKGTGIHGRINPEAQGSEAGAFIFSLEDVKIAIPNPVSISVMKLTAMRDRWDRANDAGSTPEKRSFERDQAFKHAKDVFRTVAMITKEENDNIPNILLSMKNSGVFIEAGEIFRKFFVTGAFPGITMVSTGWSQTDIETMISVVEKWFRNA